LLYDTVSVFYDYTGSSHFGLEYRKDKFYFRCGYTPLTFRKLSFGLGMNFSNITLDYAFLPFVNFGIHSLGFTYLWGEVKEERTPDEFEDFLHIQKRTYRIVDKYLRETESLVKETHKRRRLLTNCTHSIQNICKKKILYLVTMLF